MGYKGSVKNEKKMLKDKEYVLKKIFDTIEPLSLDEMCKIQHCLDAIYHRTENGLDYKIEILKLVNKAHSSYTFQRVYRLLEYLYLKEESGD